MPDRPVAVVTGASSGLGAEFARALAERGYDLILVARRRERLVELGQRLTATYGASAEVLPADLARDEDVERVAGRISEEGHLALLVNNAGFGAMGKFHLAPIERQMEMHRVHVLATVRLTHAALRVLVPLNRGGVINVASVAGFTRMPDHSSYNSTKAWMIAFTEGLYLELKSIGAPVRVQALCPGFTYTEFHDTLGMDRNKFLPFSGWWMTAEFVVADSLEHFDRGDWLVVPSWRYRLLVALLNVLPRAILHPVVTRVARRREAAARPTLH
jgi:uncharacterized protein